MHPQLKALDIVVLVALIEWQDRLETQAKLAVSLNVPPASLTRSLQRLKHTRLLRRRGGLLRAAPVQALEMFIHGVKYIFPAHLGPPTRGVPTAHSSPPLNQEISAEEAYVWPAPRVGRQRGLSVPPIYKTVPELTVSAPELHPWFALLDALRLGRVREQKLAVKHLEARMKAP